VDVKPFSTIFSFFDHKQMHRSSSILTRVAHRGQMFLRMGLPALAILRSLPSPTISMHRTINSWIPVKDDVKCPFNEARRNMFG
jgi:hypothetical protein